MSGIEDDEFDLDNPPFFLTAIDRKVLATPDHDFHRYTWDDLKRIIATNDLESLKRYPSDLRAYLRWSFATKKTYGSINNFVLRERLHWNLKDPSLPVSRTSFTFQSSTPFENELDYAVLVNDWPYGVEQDIMHLVVWSRTPIPIDDVRGDLTPESRTIVEAFMDRYFVQSWADFHGVDADDARYHIKWFKNWVSIQSIPGIDHVHIMIKAAPAKLLGDWLTRRDLRVLSQRRELEDEFSD